MKIRGWETHNGKLGCWVGDKRCTGGIITSFGSYVGDYSIRGYRVDLYNNNLQILRL